jgi:hypothetical protein
MRCNKWSVDLFCNRIVRRCNMHRCNRLRSRAAVLRCRTEHGGNTRCAVATNGQQNWLRRRTNLRSAVASRYTPLQQMGDHVGCVVARSCRALLHHAMRRCNGWATELVASSRKPECCCKHAMLLCDAHRPLGASRAMDAPPTDSACTRSAAAWCAIGHRPAWRAHARARIAACGRYRGRWRFGSG